MVITLEVSAWQFLSCQEYLNLGAEVQWNLNTRTSHKVLLKSCPVNLISVLLFLVLSLLLAKYFILSSVMPLFCEVMLLVERRKNIDILF